MDGWSGTPDETPGNMREEPSRAAPMLTGFSEATMTTLVAECAAAAMVGVLSGRRLQVELCLVRCVKPSSSLAKVCP